MIENLERGEFLAPKEMPQDQLDMLVRVDVEPIDEHLFASRVRFGVWQRENQPSGLKSRFEAWLKSFSSEHHIGIPIVAAEMIIQDSEQSGRLVFDPYRNVVWDLGTEHVESFPNQNRKLHDYLSQVSRWISYNEIASNSPVQEAQPKPSQERVDFRFIPCEDPQLLRYRFSNARFIGVMEFGSTIAL